MDFRQTKVSQQVLPGTSILLEGLYRQLTEQKPAMD